MNGKGRFLQSSKFQHNLGNTHRTSGMIPAGLRKGALLQVTRARSVSGHLAGRLGRNSYPGWGDPDPKGSAVCP